METVGLEFTFPWWASCCGLRFCPLAMGVLLLELFLGFKMPQSCWRGTASCGACVTPAGCRYSFPSPGILALRQSAKQMMGAGQQRGGCSGGKGCCCGMSLFCKLFSKLCSSPVYKPCWREGLVYGHVRLCQSRVVFLHSSILRRIWEESLNYSVTCITVCKSVYNQGLGFCPYLWMTRAESGRNSSTDTVRELHDYCGYMTLLLHARPWDGRDVWQSLCSLLWTAHAQWGLLLCKHASLTHLEVLLTDVAAVSV